METLLNRITTGDFRAGAPLPAYSVFRSEQGACELPDWRGQRAECLAPLG